MIKMSYVAYCHIHRKISLGEYISLLRGFDEWLEWQVMKL